MWSGNRHFRQDMLDASDRSFVYRLVEVAARRGMDRKKLDLMGHHMEALLPSDDGTEEDVACYAAALAVWLGRSPRRHLPDTSDETLHRTCFVLLGIKLIQAPAIQRDWASRRRTTSPELYVAMPGPGDDQALPPGEHIAEIEMFSACFHFLGRVEHCLPVAYQTDDYGAVTPPEQAPFAASSDAEESSVCLHVYRVWRDATKRTRNPGKLAVALVEDHEARRTRVEKKRKRKRNANASADAVTSPKFSAYEVVRFVNTFALRLQDFRYTFPEVLREEDGAGQWADATTYT